MTNASYKQFLPRLRMASEVLCRADDGAGCGNCRRIDRFNNCAGPATDVSASALSKRLRDAGRGLA